MTRIERVIRNPYKIVCWFVRKIPVLSHSLSDEKYLSILYRGAFGQTLDLENPKSFNEKMQWLKIHDRKPEYTNMVDKYHAKEYVSSIIGEEYIIPTLGVWNSFDDIDFDSLPDQFVLKCTHDSGGLVICRDKAQFNMKRAKKKIEKCLKNNFYWSGREWPYKGVEARIIAEQYMEDEKTNDLRESNSGLTDYKFFCFDKKPKLLYVSRGLEHHPTAEISFYDLNGRETPFHRSDYKPYHDAEMPKNFELMKKIAERLAGEIAAPFVRVDLYSINDQIYFSEITFTPCSGFIPFDPKDADDSLGRNLILPI